MEWYYAVNGQQAGPVDDEGLHALAAKGALSPTDLVWNTTMGNQWAPASSVPNLFEAPAPPQPVPAAPVAAAPAAPFVAGQTPLHSPSPGPAEPMPTSAELTARARNHMETNWGTAIGMLVVRGIIFSAVSVPCVGLIVPLLLDGAFVLGLAGFFLAAARRQTTAFPMLFDGFYRYPAALGTYILATLVISIGLCLFFVPGVIAWLAFAMTFFLLSDDNERELGPLSAMQESIRMMAGMKIRLLALTLRLLPWALLVGIPYIAGIVLLELHILSWALITLIPSVIGLLFFFPYAFACYAEFYEALRAAKPFTP